MDDVHAAPTGPTGISATPLPPVSPTSAYADSFAASFPGRHKPEKDALRRLLAQPSYASLDQICRSENSVTLGQPVSKISMKQAGQLLQCMKEKNFAAAINATTVEEWQNVDRSGAFGGDFLLKPALQSLNILKQCRQEYPRDPDGIKECYADEVDTHNYGLAVRTALGGPAAAALTVGAFVLARRTMRRIKEHRSTPIRVAHL